MSDRASSGLGVTRDRSAPTGWDRARIGVAVPLCLVVAIAIVCIIVAALTSAHRADEVAAEHERQLFLKGITNRAEWSLRKLQAATPRPDEARSIDAPRLAGHLSIWLTALQDHDLAMVADPSGNLTAADIKADAPIWSPAAYPELVPLIGYLSGEVWQLPAGMVRIATARGPIYEIGPGDPASFVQPVDGKIAIVSAVSMGVGGAVAISVMFLREKLPEIGSRLNLQDLREVSPGDASGADNVFDLKDADGNLVASFAWTPKRPGAQVLYSVVPFIGIAFAGFAVLAGLMLRYMRHTAATIAAGENRLRYLALHDPLCGLPNRNFFGERLESVIAGVRRGGPAAAVLYIDLDHFKDVNDTLGHPVGDELIRAVTLRLSRTLRGDDLVARLGGDEFAVITANSADPDSLHDMAERLIATLCAPYSIGGHTIVIGASIGIALIDHRSAAEAADIMRFADMALYRAKNEGRNRACIYDAVMDADLSRRKRTEQDLREAIEGGTLNVLYQPIVNASGETTVAVEALARWPHPVRGMISPAEFIPIAEHSGLIIELGTHVLRRACIDARSWPDLTVAVNVSPLQFRQHDFVFVVERILRETGLDPSRLELELTETTLLGNVDGAVAAMQRLKALGVRLALDDFGTGYSSLLYLRRFPFDKLKIDRGFVQSIEKAADAAAIVHAVVSLGRGLGMKVTAEGVETAEQHLFLRAAGVHFIQGFRFGRPVEAAEISKRLATPGVYRSIEGDAAAALAG